jgi:uncharacterized repeat protein (TIGR03803 family)
VYELSPTPDGRWRERVLHDFDNDGKDGVTPGNGALMMDSFGNLYGTTESGGCCGGTVFKLTPGSNGKWTYTVLHRFNGGDGAVPEGNLILDNKGNLCGGTVLGGDDSNGVIFELTP